MLSLVLCSCTAKNDSNNQPVYKAGSEDKSLYEHGLEVVSLLDEMIRNEEYREALNSSTEISDAVSTIQNGDYSTPKAAYQITLTEDSFSQVMAMNNINSENLSNKLKEYLNKKVITNIVTLINARSGSTNVAVSSIYSVETSFLSDKVDENAIYIYTYESGFPVMITFVTNENGITNANGAFIMDDQFSGTTVEEVKDYVRKTIYLSNCEVKQIEAE